ncbi:hypothetical protein EJP82_26660 [Paenibacillus anaericanus]|uniref:Uncharacterized protein n=1 Tax=Paenibacillus anaericanus TaxID=170367 RepID=A0A3S1BG34_9BACL|nr:hypothetical protein [Paenibacillus anaericanus]RUT38698.1 hypothetical protein EJP82_26660 [Paenibacillus anaericanus]
MFNKTTALAKAICFYFKPLFIILLLFMFLKDIPILTRYPLVYVLVSLFPAGWHLINRLYNGGHLRLNDSISILHDTFWVGSPFEMTMYLVNKSFKLLVSILLGWLGAIFIVVDFLKMVGGQRMIDVKY